MSIEKGKISGQQLMFLITGFMQGAILYVAFATAVTLHDTWIVVLTGFMTALPVILLYVALAKRFAGMNLVEIHDTVYGPFLGKAISALYILFFLNSLTLNIRDIGSFYSVFMMPDTPVIFFYIFFTLVCAYLVASGIEVFARISHLIVVVIFFNVISTFLLLLPNMDFTNFLPFFEISLKDFVHGTHIIYAIPFGGSIIVFLTIMSSMNDYKSINKNTLLALGLGALGLLIVTIRDTAVLGDSQAILTSPPFQSIRLIDVGNVFIRLDVLIGVGLTFSQLLRSSILYYGVVISLTQLLRLRTYLPLVLPVGGIAIIMASILFKSSAENAYYGQNVFPFFVIPFAIIIPVLTLLIAKIRNLPKEGKP